MTQVPRVTLLLALSCCGHWLWGGVAKNLQTPYIGEFENHAVYLKVPVHGARQVVFAHEVPRLDRSSRGLPLSFKIGDPVRVLNLSFRDEGIRFRVASVDMSRQSELFFQFRNRLTSDFPQKAQFDAALAYVFASGSSYKEIDSAKETFIEDQYAQIVKNLASSIDGSTEFVEQQILQQNPEFDKTRTMLESREQELSQVRSRLEQERIGRQQAISRADELERRLAQSRAENEKSELERTRLARQRDQLQDENERLEQDNLQWKQEREAFEGRIRQLIRDLGVESDSRAKLGNQVSSLESMLEDLQQKSGDLSEKLSNSETRVSELEQVNQELTDSKARVERERNRLSASLRELTSDKNSLNARYLKTSEENRTMKLTQKLTEALRVRRLEDSQEGDSFEVFLLSQKLATLSVEPPARPLVPHGVSLELLSPETVTFSEQERELYEFLGPELTVETSWDSSHDALRPVLIEGEKLQIIKSRETGSWNWQFEGNLAGFTPVVLRVDLFAGGEQRVPLFSHEYTLSAVGLSGLLGQELSLLSILIGFMGGFSLFALVLLIRSRRTASRQRLGSLDPIVQKKL